MSELNPYSLGDKVTIAGIGTIGVVTGLKDDQILVFYTNKAMARSEENWFSIEKVYLSSFDDVNKNVRYMTDTHLYWAEGMSKLNQRPSTDCHGFCSNAIGAVISAALQEVKESRLLIDRLRATIKKET